MKTFNQLSRLFTVLAFIMMLGASNARSADMCYDPPVVTGLICLNIFSLGCTETTPIRNISSSTLTNTTIVHAYQGFSFDLGNSIGIDTVNKTVNKDGDSAEYEKTLNAYTNFNGFFDFNIFDKGIVYRTGDYAPSNADNTTDQHTVFVGNFFSMGFESERYLATYTKDSVVYNTRIYPCGTKLVTLSPSKSIIEGNTTTTSANFTVTLSEKPTKADMYVNYTISAVTATQGTDYSAPSYSGQLEFKKNTPTLTQTIPVSVMGDLILEANETFKVTITSLTQGSTENFLIDESFQNGVVTIIDDDNIIGGGGVTSPAMDSCGMFPSVLTAQNNIEQTAGITCSLSDPGNVGNDITVINTTVINASNVPNNMVGCAVAPPPPVIVLPPFLHSSNMGSEQSISVNTTITDQDVKSLKIASNGITVTFTANQPYYSDSTINVMKIGTVNDQNSQDITYVFNEGDYWIENWNTNGNNVVIKINGHVRLFIGDNFTANTNNLLVNVAPNSGIPSNLYVYAYNDVVFSSDGSANYNVNGYFYAANNFVANGSSQNQNFTGAIRAGNNISLGSNQHFYYDSSGAGGGAQNCTPPSYNLTGPFDAWDTWRNPNAAILVNDRNISMKIAGKDFNLIIASLNSAETAITLKASGVKAYYKLYDFNTSTSKTNYAEFNASTWASITSSTFNIPDATQNMKVVFKFCADKNSTNYILKPDSACTSGNLPVCTTLNTTCYRETVSLDAFAVRPEKLNISSANTAFPNLMRSDEEYNLSIKGYSYNSTTPTPYYNIPSANTVLDINTTKYDRNYAVNASMAGTASFSTTPFNMLNGQSERGGVVGDVAGTKFSDVGLITLQIHDQVWSAIDNDDTPMNCDANGTYICGDKNVTYIPDHFDFNELNITNNNGNPGSFTYIANEVDKMAGRIHTKIRALNKSNAVTQNFAQTPLWENPISVVPVVVKSTYLYPDANETNITSLTVGFGIGTDVNGTKTIAWNETNTSKYLRYNFRRDVNLPQNSFDVTGSDLNISMTSQYVDGTSVANITGSRLGTVLPASGGSKFVYGRVVPRDIRVFGANTPFSANGWYEVFNTSAIGTTTLPKSKNDSTWFTNTLHNDGNDGDANVTVVITGANPTSTTAVNGVETYLFGNSYALGGYQAHILTAPWLWYGLTALAYLDPANPANLNCLKHPCFNINVVPEVGATGSAKNTNEGTKASKSSSSNGWRSINDYAPAIR